MLNWLSFFYKNYFNPDYVGGNRGVWKCHMYMIRKSQICKFKRKNKKLSADKQTMSNRKKISNLYQGINIHNKTA